MLADTTRAAAAVAIITKGLGILKFVTTTGPDIRCAKARLTTSTQRLYRNGYQFLSLHGRLYDFDDQWLYFNTEPGLYIA